MDDEDLGEFGIAPQKIQTKEDFTNDSKKRKHERPSEGPIPGEPVLKNLLKPLHDKAAVRILKSMGWRDNQGIGSRQTYREKKNANERNKREMCIQKKYGCDMGPGENQSADSEDDNFSDEEITFAPDDFDPFIANIKNNSFGLGYSGLKPTSSGASSHHINLFHSFEVVDRNNKKLSIRGQAFGVGALEEEDDDIYAPDDMSRYDKSLEDAHKIRKKEKAIKAVNSALIEGFSKATISDSTVRVFSVDVSRNYVPRNWLTRRSRFQPLDRTLAKQLEEKNRHKVLGLGRHDLKPEQRGALLNDKNDKSEQRKEPEIAKPSVFDEHEEERKERNEERARKLTELLNSKQFVGENNATVFKPFMSNLEKQERYEKFVALNSSKESDIEKLLNDIQPLSMSSFHREMEKKEFMQAKRMYQPLDSLMANRFIKEVDLRKEEKKKKKIENGKEVSVIQRSKVIWKPHRDLCKRFNVPEPFGGMMFDENEEKKRKKHSSSLFDYIGVPLNTKANFVNPQVIPRKLAVDNRKLDAEDEQRKKFLEAVEKEKSFMSADKAKRSAAKDFFEDSQPSTSKIAQEPSRVVRKDIPDVPRTELENKVHESIHKKPEEKKDLFKAIFCDSDDDEDEEEQEAGREDSKEATILSETQKSTFIESFLNTKSASEINVLRNDEAPRGIFKSILQMSSSVETHPGDGNKKVDDNVQRSDNLLPPEVFGPRLPEKPFVAIDHSTSTDAESSLDGKILKKLKKAKKSCEDVEWVEKDKLKQSKKSKKHKKEHKKHKKHKSKK